MSGIQKSFLIIVFLLPFLIVDIIKYFTLKPEELSETRIVVHIEQGATLSQIADTLYKYQLIENRELFNLWATSLGYQKKLRAGIFEIPADLNYPQLVNYLATAKSRQLLVTLIEGWQTDEITAQLARQLKLDKSLLDSLCSDADFIRRLGIDDARVTDLTGYLLPDTYSFAPGITEGKVLAHLVKKNLELFASDSARSALRKWGLTRHEILTLASIVEGEAILDSERTVIASVYHNRLRRRMKLQADPTIQFILPGKPRRLLHRDLKIDSPYNTYLYYGLPPGPINNPGKASILATLFPAQTDFLYFVARGDGSHVFCRTAREHSRAKAAFNKIRRRVYGRNSTNQ